MILGRTPGSHEKHWQKKAEGETLRFLFLLTFAEIPMIALTNDVLPIFVSYINFMGYND